MQRLDRGHRVRRDAVARRIEFDLIEKPAPARIDLVGRVAVFVIVTPPIPAPFRHLFDGIDPVEDVFPIGREIPRLGQHRAQPDNGDPRPRPLGHVGRVGWVGWVGRGRERRQCGRQHRRRRRAADRIVQGGDGCRPLVQVGHLPDHVNAEAHLILARQRHQFRRPRDLAEIGIAIDPLGGDPQTPDVEAFQLVAHRLGVQLCRAQGSLGALEFGHDRAVEHPRRVALPGFQQHGAGRFQHQRLVGRHHRTAADGLGGQDVAGADDHPDPCPARREIGGQRRNHRARARIMHAAGKDQVAVDRAGRAEMIKHRVNRLLPQHRT